MSRVAGQRTPRSEGATQNPPGTSKPRWAHLRSRPFRYVEPFQAGGRAQPPRARGEGGVERGPTDSWPSPLVACRPAAAACWPRRVLEPGRAIWAQGRRGGSACTPGARGAAWANRWGGRQRCGIHHPATQSVRVVQLGSTPLPPIPSHLLLRRCLGSPGGGTRGAAAGGSGAAVAHAPGPEPCSSHGRSSLCSCPPLHQALKPRRLRPLAPPTGPAHRRFQFLFPTCLWVPLVSCYPRTPKSVLTLAPVLIGTSAS